MPASRLDQLCTSPKLATVLQLSFQYNLIEHFYHSALSVCGIYLLTLKMLKMVPLKTSVLAVSCKSCCYEICKDLKLRDATYWLLLQSDQSKMKFTTMQVLQHNMFTYNWISYLFLLQLLHNMKSMIEHSSIKMN